MVKGRKSNRKRLYNRFDESKRRPRDLADAKRLLGSLVDYAGDYVKTVQNIAVFT